MKEKNLKIFVCEIFEIENDLKEIKVLKISHSNIGKTFFNSLKNLFSDINNYSLPPTSISIGRLLNYANQYA